MNRTHRDTIIKLVNGDVTSIGYRCLEVEWVASESILRVYLENEHRQFGMDDCLKATQKINENAQLDLLVPGPYTLEVSSPGVERPIRAARDFERYVGQKIEVKLTESTADRKHGKGRLVAVTSLGETYTDPGSDREVSDREIEVTIDTNRGLWKFSLASLSSANLVYDWGQPN